jgi:hypothetical protein
MHTYSFFYFTTANQFDIDKEMFGRIANSILKEMSFQLNGQPVLGRLSSWAFDRRIAALERTGQRFR